jgi:putative aldouronate transport system substrate-binding protein
MGLAMLVSMFACASPSPINTAPASTGTPNPDVTTDVSPSGSAPAVDISEFVTVKYLMLGDKQPGDEAVYKQLNTWIKEKYNAEVTVEMIPWADWTTRYPLLFSAKEDFDIIPMSPSFNYFDYAPDGVLREISDEILQTYMPLTWANQSHVLFEEFYVGGKCYTVPINFPSLTFGLAVALRTDLLQKYNMEIPKTWEDMEAFFDAVLQNEQGVYPAAMSSSDNGRDPTTYLYYEYYSKGQVNGLMDYFVYQDNGNKHTKADITLMVDDPDYAAAIKKIKTWADKGYWSKNANVNTTSNRDAFESGTSASLFQNIGTAALSALTINGKDNGWSADIVNVNTQTTRTEAIPSGGISCPIWAKNWERALMTVDFLKFDLDAYHTVRYGLEGVNWKYNGDDKTKWVPLDQKSYVFGNGNSWQLKNQYLPYEMDRFDQLQSYIDLWNGWQTNLLPASNLALFNFDSTKVATELANMNNVVSKYKLLLAFGLVDNVDATIAEYKAALVAAGVDKVRAELDSQLDAFLASK